MRPSGYAPAPLAWYVEPAWAVDALLDGISPIVGAVWDPACGEGTIPKACAKRGIRAIGTDLVFRGYGAGNVDFFAETKLRAPNIICNPPFSRSLAWVHHALSLGVGRLIMLEKLAFLESARRFNDLFREHPPSYVHVHVRRVSCPPGGLGIPAQGGTVAYAWFEWGPHVSDGPLIRWLP